MATFGSASPSIDETDHILEAMELIAPLCENDIAQKSYQLFRVVMQTPVSLAYSPEKKWDMSLPRVVDPQDILTFSDHHSHFLMLVYAVFTFFVSFFFLFLFLLKVFLL